jgi:hypothetical protein
LSPNAKNNKLPPRAAATPKRLGLALQLTGDFNYANPEDYFKNILKEIGARNGLRT